ncbi:hypothetical protein AKJ63_00390 [candidate division MSBL1 archaeon SCGC-AAA259D18]|uniref:Uncharacterized protein n=1 Tax=candidate division MSBL1 archaeon SCGC-AAA259D18 TaxID=1698262 RepID=A0A133UCM7_9EURY|nr:hypothetical protein AKJ63_00390 [candidate division MSBL1 archaeon SCGC-AAA259D18]
MPVIFSKYVSIKDSNYYDDCGYKKKLQEILETEAIELVLDIHGAKKEREFDIDSGTIYGESLVEKKTYSES